MVCCYLQPATEEGPADAPAPDDAMEPAGSPEPIDDSGVPGPGMTEGESDAPTPEPETSGGDTVAPVVSQLSWPIFQPQRCLKNARWGISSSRGLNKGLMMRPVSHALLFTQLGAGQQILTQLMLANWHRWKLCWPARERITGHTHLQLRAETSQ